MLQRRWYLGYLVWSYFALFTSNLMMWFKVYLYLGHDVIPAEYGTMSEIFWQHLPTKQKNNVKSRPGNIDISGDRPPRHVEVCRTINFCRRACFCSLSSIYFTARRRSSHRRCFFSGYIITLRISFIKAVSKRRCTEQTPMCQIKVNC